MMYKNNYRFKIGDVITVESGIDIGCFGLIIELIEGRRYIVETELHPSGILLHESQLGWTAVCDEPNELAEDL